MLFLTYTSISIINVSEIITIFAKISLMTKDIYDLQGRRVNGKLGKGLYIINGKKVILR